MATSIKFEYNDSDLEANLVDFGHKVNKTITLTTDFGKTRGIKEMKTKAPWTDRTTNARSGLNGSAEHNGSGGHYKHLLAFFHGVDYGIWLEVANGGKYQIIMPTVVQVANEIFKSLDNLFNKMGIPPELKVNLDLKGPGHQGTSQGITARAGKQARRAKRTTKTRTTNRTKRT